MPYHARESYDGRETYPGVLRGYKVLCCVEGWRACNGVLTFRPDRAKLKSPNKRHTWSDGVNVASCHLKRVDYAQCSLCSDSAWILYFRWQPPPMPEYVNVYCVHLDKRITIELVDEHDDGRAAHKDCVCGFYATYNPFSLLGAPGVSIPLDCDGDERMALAVVKASGRIVLGTKGFRAEKMEIEAWESVTLNTYIDVARKISIAYPPDDVTSLGVKDASPTSTMSESQL